MFCSGSWPSVVLTLIAMGIESTEGQLSRVTSPLHASCNFPVTFSGQLDQSIRNWRQPKHQRYKGVASNAWEQRDQRGQPEGIQKPLQRIQVGRRKVSHGRPKSPTTKVDEECDGYENFLHDLEVLSLELTVAGYIKASIAWFLHLLNQAYGLISVYFIGGKERITFVVNLLFPATIPEEIERWFGILGLLDYIVTRYLSYPLGNFIFVIDTIGQTLGLISLLLDIFTTFSDVFEPIVTSITGIDLKVTLSDYACANSFEPNRVIQPLIELFG